MGTAELCKLWLSVKSSVVRWAIDQRLFFNVHMSTKWENACFFYTRGRPLGLNIASLFKVNFSGIIFTEECFVLFCF
jgi:hypothetical protein